MSSDSEHWQEEAKEGSMGNPFQALMDIVEKQTEANEHKYKNWHERFLSSEDTRAQFYKSASRLDSWLLFEEAVPFYFGAPGNGWAYIKKLYANEVQNLERLIRAAVGVSLPVVDPKVKEKQLRVKPKDFVKWAQERGLIRHEEILSPVGLSNNQEAGKTVKNPKNAERHALKREAVYRAAFAVLAEYPDQCRKNGKVVVARVSRLIEEKSPLLFEEDEVPIGPDKVSRILNEAIKALK